MTTRANPISAQQIADLLKGTLVGDPAVTVTRVNLIEDAGPTELAFVGSLKELPRISQTEAGILIVPNDARDDSESWPERTYIFVENPEVGFLSVAEQIRPPRPRPNVGVSPQAVVHPTATVGARTNVHPMAVIERDVVIGEFCDIGPGAVIGAGTVIGDETSIDANVVIYPDVEIGSRCELHAGCVIGGIGFGYRQDQGRHVRLPHVGRVCIKDDVHIGSCTIVNRGKAGDTTIDSGTRVDGQVMIAHNCRIGKHNLLISQTGLAGSVTTGEYVVCAGQAGIADHVHLADQTIIGAKTGVHRDMQGGRAYLGIPAREAAEHAREQMALKRLPDLRDTVKQLQKQITAIEGQLDQLGGTKISDARDAA